MSTFDNARSQLKQHQLELLRRANVVATGIGYKTSGGKRTAIPSIICSVEKKVSVAALSARDVIPARLDDIPTDVVETGLIRAWQAPTERFRPAPGGVSVGHKDITAGTLGCWVKRNGQWMILSNNHVLANSNDAASGDAILQPGPYDGGSLPQDQIATLEAYVPISFSGSGSGSGCSIANQLAHVLNSLAALLGSTTRLQAIRIQAEGSSPQPSQGIGCGFVEASHVPPEIHRRVGGKRCRNESGKTLHSCLLSNQSPRAIRHLSLSTLDKESRYQKIRHYF